MGCAFISEKDRDRFPRRPPFQIMYSTTQSKNWKRTLTESVAVDATAGERISTDTLVGERVSADALAGERVGVERMRVGAAF